jgi:hypothetical protein
MFIITGIFQVETKIFNESSISLSKINDRINENSFLGFGVSQQI